MKTRTRTLWGLLAVAAGVLALVAAGCGGGDSSSSGGGGSEGESSGLPTKIGPGEGTLDIVAWEGYAEDDWVKPFEQESGCQVNAKYAGSSDEMVTLMRSGGGGQYDLVSASGDASLRLIAGGDVQPVNTDLIPDFKDFIPALQSPPHNTVDGKHYGISYEWGPNTLLYNTDRIKAAPTSWAVLYDDEYKGQITVPDNPIQIADAALFLSKTQPDLGIEDPYELNQKQFDAAIDLLKRQEPLVKKYWALASDEIDLFKNGDANLGASWPYQTNILQADKVPVKDLIPTEGATGWADTWMLSSKAQHPNCAYMFMKYVSTPKVQAQQAISFGETPANTKACPEMDKLDPGSCAKYHADAPASYFEQIKFWKTPVADCGNGQQDCLDYTAWQQAWTELRG
ncbi:MAG TPA: ABC transporter substrate-binding protein [Gaiellaceae bacterium]|jgi:putative spermidine/putrescine transport system substrate-binding protein